MKTKQASEGAGIRLPHSLAVETVMLVGFLDDAQWFPEAQMFQMLGACHHDRDASIA